MRTLLWIMLAVLASSVHADERAEFNRRAAAEDTATFRALDRNGDGKLAREEAKADLNLGPRFDDMDIDRNGIVTSEELRRYLELRYGAGTT